MDEKLILEAAEVLAVAKVLKEKSTDKAREDVKVGQHVVDVTVHISGTVTVGEDYPIAPTAKGLSLETVAILLAHCGITREAAVKAVMRAVNDTKTAADEARQTAVDEFKTGLQAEFAKQPKINARGKVTTKLEITKVA